MEKVSTPGIDGYLKDSLLSIRARKASAVSTDSSDADLVAITSTASARTVTLKKADLEERRVVIVKDESGGANAHNITIDTEGSELIDGAATLVISANYGVARLYSNGINWFSF